MAIEEVDVREMHARVASKIKPANVLAAMAGKDSLTTKELYSQLALDLDLDPVYATSTVAVGKDCKQHNLFGRRVRWHLQTLAKLGIVQRMDRGKWGVCREHKKELTEAPSKQVLIAFNTDLGVGLWGRSEDVFLGLKEEIHLAFTSPPFPLSKARQYGNVAIAEYVDWLIGMMEPVTVHLSQGGSIVLNLSNDIFLEGSPARSTYLERLTIAMEDKLGLYLMERFVWENPTKPPGPVLYASVSRVHVNVGWEPVLWFSNDPKKALANNRRVLIPHTEAQLSLMEKGGETRTGIYSGGAYRIRPGSFGNQTEGRIPTNVLRIPHKDSDQKPARDYAKLHGIPAHPALMPTRLSDFFVNFLTRPDDLVVDPFGGWGTTGRSAEKAGRRWLIVEKCREYIAAAAERFRHCNGFTVAN